MDYSIPPSIFHHIYFDMFYLFIFFYVVLVGSLAIALSFLLAIFVHVRGIQSMSNDVFVSHIFGKFASVFTFDGCQFILKSTLSKRTGEPKSKMHAHKKHVDLKWP